MHANEQKQKAGTARSRVRNGKRAHIRVIFCLKAFGTVYIFSKTTPLLMPGSFGLASPKALRSFTETLGSTQASFTTGPHSFHQVFVFSTTHMKRQITHVSFRLLVDTEAMFTLPLSTLGCLPQNIP